MSARREGPLARRALERSDQCRRAGILLVLLLLGPRAAAADEPGVQPTQGEEPGLVRAPDLSDAKKRSRGFWALRERGPRLKLGYRTFSVGEMGDRSARYHGVAFDAYFYSGFLRAGAGLEGSVEDSDRDNFLLNGVLNVGAQYPMRITPFLDFTLGLGVLRRDVLYQDLVDFAYHVGIEGGAEVFVGPGVVLSATLGWRRQMFRHGGNDQVESVYVYFDSVTVKVGFGF